LTGTKIFIDKAKSSLHTVILRRNMRRGS